jgi:HPt (histidine-containing phosphotransfer) domain-containing protein
MQTSLAPDTNPPADPSSPPVVDLARALARLGGNLELLRRIALPFVDDAPKILAELRVLVERRDAGATAFAAHRLRGQAASFDATALVSAAASLEDAARGGAWPVADQTHEILQRELEKVVDALRASVRG